MIFLSGWLPDFSIPYTLFSLLTPVEAGDSLACSGRWLCKLYARADDNEHDVWRVGWRDGWTDDGERLEIGTDPCPDILIRCVLDL